MFNAIEVCQALARADIWLELHPETQALKLGPTVRVQAHPELLEQVRAQKAAIMEALQTTLAYEVMGTPPVGRFHTEPCPACHQDVCVVVAPRRLAMHRTPDNRAVCPGAIQAQEAVAEALMTRFTLQRCVVRPHALLTWIALHGALEGWAREQGWLLPPRPYIVAWMDGHFTRRSKDEVYASWTGLTFTLEEWLGDDAEAPPPAAPTDPHFVLKAS